MPPLMKINNFDLSKVDAEEEKFQTFKREVVMLCQPQKQEVKTFTPIEAAMKMM